MTTEVLRNMLYAGSSTLNGLGFVVMDEVHYLADRFRGAVWEEVIIHLPESVALVSLSATVSNAEEFGEWLETVRGETTTIVEERRPVPLYQHVMVGKKIYDLFEDDVSDDRRRSTRTWCGSPATTGGPARTRDHRSKRNAPAQPAAGARGQGPRGSTSPSRYDVVERLDAPGPAAGDHLRLQPGRLRRRGHPVPERQPQAHLRPRSATRSGRSSRSAAATSPTRTCTCSATTTSSRA